VREERIVLEQHSNIAPLGRDMYALAAIEPDPISKLHVPSLRPLEAREAAKHGGLSRPRCAEEHGHSRLAHWMLPPAGDCGALRTGIARSFRGRIAKFDIDVEERHIESVRFCSE
jgi:hypothetical protein